jgi:hypothetical protein
MVWLGATFQMSTMTLPYPDAKVACRLSIRGPCKACSQRRQWDYWHFFVELRSAKYLNQVLWFGCKSFGATTPIGSFWESQQLSSQGNDGLYAESGLASFPAQLWLRKRQLSIPPLTTQTTLDKAPQASLVTQDLASKNQKVQVGQDAGKKKEDASERVVFKFNLKQHHKKNKTTLKKKSKEHLLHAISWCNYVNYTTRYTEINTAESNCFRNEKAGI